MANQPRRQSSVEDEQQLAQEAQQRGMTVDDLKKQRESEREQISSQGTTEIHK